MAVKTADQEFESSWNKAAAWAQTQGIPASDYLPVYQMDAQRLQTGESQMSAAERNRAILAANNPNNVTQLPSDKPSPSSVLGNARNDLGMIATGLEPQHLVANLFDTFKNTAEDMIDPKRLVGSSLEATGANILQNTLLSFVPGAYDVGTLLRGGVDALAEHPLVALLDLLPAGASKLLTGALADTAMGARLAEFGGTTTDALKQKPLTSALGSSLMNHVTGSSPLGLSKGTVQQLTIGERLQKWMGNTALGTSKPIQEFAGEYMQSMELPSQIKRNVMNGSLTAYEALKPEEKQLFDQLMTDLRMDRKDTQQVLNDRAYPISVTDAIRQFLNGPVRFQTEEAILAPTSVRGDKPDIMPIRRPDGTTALYAGKGTEPIINAREPLKEARSSFVAELDATDALRTRVEGMDAQRPQLLQELKQGSQAAYQRAGQDEGLLSNIIGPDKEVFGRKADQVRAMFGDGGATGVLQEALDNQDFDALEVRAKTLSKRLDSWGYHSVDASSDPAFVAVKNTVDKVAKYAHDRNYLNDEIDRRINKEPDRVTAEVQRQRALLKTEHARRRTEVRENHRAQHEDQNERRAADIAKVRSDLQTRVADLRKQQQMEDAEDVAIGDNAARRATKAQTDVIHSQVKVKIAARAKQYDKDIKAEKDRHDKLEAGINKTWDISRGKLDQRQETDWEALKDSQREASNNVGGPLKQKMRTYVKALDDFHKAVYDHPSDDFRDVRTELYKERLLASERNAEIVDASMKNLNLDQSRVATIRSDPAVLGETVRAFVEDVYKNPDNFDTDIVDAVNEAHEEAEQQAIQEINTLIALGHKPVWMPAAGPSDRVSSAISIQVGHGAPHVDVAHARSNFGVNTRYDIVAGGDKGVTETLTRDATIDLIENSVVPRTTTGEALATALNKFGILDDLGIVKGFDPNAETLPHAYSQRIAEMGLTKIDPQGMFGFQFPRWEGKAIYMPTELARALEKMMALQKKGDMGVWDKATRLFKFSILGLSPRYTAHILFGGTFLLALRSTPYMPFMLVKAAKALKAGADIPHELLTRTPTQEGYSRMTTALNQQGHAAGKQMGNLAIQEHMSLIQHVTDGKASPIHWLKAAADINFRFTRYVTKMQQAVAYMDYAASAERRGYFIDEVTGQKMVMTRERATMEGMKHVEAVFGNLRNMSPLERQLAKNVMPFYGWTRHILGYISSFPFDHPWRAMTLALMAFENSASVPEGLPERLQFLFFLGKPDAQGNVSAIDTRFLDPLRDVANYATLGGWLESLNPALIAPLAVINPQMVYGSNELYPNLTYNQFYGIETASSQGNLATAAEQFIPQLGAVGPLAAAIKSAGNLRKLSNNPNAFYKSIFESLNIPFAQVQHINVKQIAAHDEIARYQVAKQASTNAFQSGDFSQLAGYSSVPNPLNPDYEISPAQLEAVYNQAAQQYPGQAPIEVLPPPATPVGY